MKDTIKKSDIDLLSTYGAHLVQQGAQGLLSLAQAFPPHFPQALQALKNLKGKLICIGIGKSGHVARKAASTFSSTGQPSFFVHATEALHGDLGVLQEGDGVFFFSNSGQTDEILTLISLLKDKHLILGMTQDPESPLACLSDYALILPPVQEMCPLGLAPSTSALMMMALADTLAFSLSHERGFTYAQYHACHPGGMLGYRLFTVGQVMKKPAPLASIASPLSMLIQDLVTHRLGCLGLCDAQGQLKAILEEKDVPHFLTHGIESLLKTPLLSISSDWKVEKAIAFCQSHKMKRVFVVDEHKRPIGLFEEKKGNTSS